MGLKKYSSPPLLIGVLSGAIYGLWATYANWGHDAAQVARAGAAQFVLSFCSTSFLALMMELLLKRGRSPRHLVVAATVPHFSMVALFLTTHWLSGTPRVFKTIAPSATIGLLFSIVYVLKRSRTPLVAQGPAGVASGLHVSEPEVP